MELAKRLFDVNLNSRKRVEVMREGLPTLNILNDFGGLLALPEINQVTWQGIFGTILNECQGSKENT